VPSFVRVDKNCRSNKSLAIW